MIHFHRVFYRVTFHSDLYEIFSPNNKMYEHICVLILKMLEEEEYAEPAKDSCNCMWLNLSRQCRLLLYVSSFTNNNKCVRERDLFVLLYFPHLKSSVFMLHSLQKPEIVCLR